MPAAGAPPDGQLQGSGEALDDPANLPDAAALILEWFRICLRQGSIAARVRRNANQPVARRDPEMATRQIASERRRLGVPYGPAAEALNLTARAGPPSLDEPTEPIPAREDTSPSGP